MKRQGDKTYDFFLKRSKSGKDEADRQTELSSGISSPGSYHPGTSQERECEAQHSPSSPGQSIYRSSHNHMLSSVILSLVLDILNVGY